MSNDEYVGCCVACGGQMYRYEVVACPLCSQEVHRGCLVNCAHCGVQGCKSCMLLDEDTLEYFCNTAGPDDRNKPKSELIKISECRIAFKEKSNAS